MKSPKERSTKGQIQRAEQAFRERRQNPPIVCLNALRGFTRFAASACFAMTPTESFPLYGKLERRRLERAWLNSVVGPDIIQENLHGAFPRLTLHVAIVRRASCVPRRSVPPPNIKTTGHSNV